MTRQPLSELPLQLFLPSLFPAPQPTPHTPHPGAYKPRQPPPSPSHHPSHLYPHAKGLKRPHPDSPGKSASASAKRRHLDAELGEGRVAKRLFDDLTPKKLTGAAGGTSTPVRTKKQGLAPSPEIVPLSRSMPPPPKPAVTKPKSSNASLSAPSSALHARSPSPMDEEKENLPPRPRRIGQAPVSASKDKSLHFTPNTPRHSAAKGKGKELSLGLAIGLGVGKPATPREIGKEMMLREVEEPEEVGDEIML